MPSGKHNLLRENHADAGHVLARLRLREKETIQSQTMKKGNGTRILLADDDPAVRSLLARVLESEGFELVQAQSGREAVSKLLDFQPDLVLLDVKMPDKDGWEAYELMEKINPLSRVIVITALPNQYQRAAALGIDALMEKPLDLPLLIGAIRTLLAESDRDRVARLTKGDFTTMRLGTRHGTRQLGTTTE